MPCAPSRCPWLSALGADARPHLRPAVRLRGSRGMRPCLQGTARRLRTATAGPARMSARSMDRGLCRPRPSTCPGHPHWRERCESRTGPLEPCQFLLPPSTAEHRPRGRGQAAAATGRLTVHSTVQPVPSGPGPGVRPVCRPISAAAGARHGGAPPVVRHGGRGGDGACCFDAGRGSPACCCACGPSPSRPRGAPVGGRPQDRPRPDHDGYELEPDSGRPRYLLTEPGWATASSRDPTVTPAVSGAVSGRPGR